MIGRIDEITAVGPIISLSTTSSLTARKCHLRAAWEQSGGEYTLPSPPSMQLGSVIHHLFEAAAKGTVRDANAISALWGELLSRAEAGLAASWVERHLVPLCSSIADFEVRRLRALRLAEELARTRHRSQVAAGARSREHLGLEVSVESTNGCIRGRIDRVREDSFGIVLQDYKSGYLPTDDEGTPEATQDQEKQLKLYAALFSEKFRLWPDKLQIVAVSGAVISVPFSRSECVSALAEAQGSFMRIAAVAGDGSRTAAEQQFALAEPSAVGCCRCPYRAQCVPYLIALLARPSRRTWPTDVAGILESRRNLGNGTTLLNVRSGPAVIHIRGLEASGTRHPALHQMKEGDAIAVFGLGRTQASDTLTTKQLTTVYRMNGAQWAYVSARTEARSHARHLLPDHRNGV